MPRDFYASDLTDRSFAVLNRLVDEFPAAVLIGGWGTWVRFEGAKSHDIDLIVGNADLDSIRNHPLIADFSATEHVGGKKCRATIDEIHLDLYVPYQSRLGQRLQLRAEDLLRHGERVDKWHVLTAAAHTATKVAALLDRPDTQPGEKDRHELLALIADVEPRDVVRVIGESSERPLAEIRKALTDELFSYLAEVEPGKKQRKALRLLATDYDAAVTQAVAEGGS
jgi:hypothetical protein